MRITITAIGSRGDVQPCVALGIGLKRAGYQVRIAAYGLLADFVRRHDLEFAPITGNPREAMETQAGQAWQASGENAVKFIRGIRNLATFEQLRQSLDDTVDACRGTDAILYSVMGAAGYHVAEMMRIPSLYLLLQPLTRSRETPCLFAPTLPLGGSYKWWTYIVYEQLLWQMVRVPINQWRRESLKLKPLPLRGPFDGLYKNNEPFIYGFSRYVVPRPNDWPPEHHITGYWFLDDANDWSPPSDLSDFLAREPKPIYIGFGSMSGHSARRLADLSIEAVTLANQRAVLLGGWAAAHERDLPSHIYAIDSAPHDWLFPRVAAVVHHGGAGTTAAGLRAGCPSVILPFMGDQPYWGQRVHVLGVGPKPILPKELTARRLADAITRAITDEEMKQRAVALGEKIHAEDGVARAVELVRRYVER
ncbi:MAG: glycosyltransferase family 1 protein [Chloroflexi bacterium]|nr:glycosyltransferase family 1 protein [Chloroflexota bacterium]